MSACVIIHVLKSRGYETSEIFSSIFALKYCFGESAKEKRKQAQNAMKFQGATYVQSYDQFDRTKE